jgi:hypothetical protein
MHLAHHANPNSGQDEDWTEEERQHQGFTAEEYGMLSEMLGPRGVNFDNDDDPVPDEIDFAGDPILQLDMVVCACMTHEQGTSDLHAQGQLKGFLKEYAARDQARFGQTVDQLSAQEIMLVRSVLAE